MKKILPVMLALMLLLAGCRADTQTNTPAPTQEDDVLKAGITRIELSDEAILVNGEAVSEDKSAAVYTARDIVFYPAGQDFTFGEGTKADEHEQSEADEHTVVHITKSGTYILSGKLSSGQVAVDLGDGAEDDPEAVVTLILDGIDITCTVAPGVIFYNVYECGINDEAAATEKVDTSAAGANVIIADGSANTVNGSYVARIYKSYTLNEAGTEVIDSKKLHKYDAAFYSKMSMNIDGESAGTGVLNINAENEGLDSELHLTINGGNINITSGNDGINTNEDGISVTTINGGNLNIRVTGETGEGDGIDSNGWLVINGGTVIASACADSADAGIDSDMGIHINGGTVAASGNMLDHISGGDKFAVFSFAQRQEGGRTYTLKNEAGETAAEYTPENAFTCMILASDKMEPGNYTLWQGETQLAGSSSEGGMGRFPGGGEPPEMPEGMEPLQRPEGMELPENMKPGQRPEMPEGMEPGRFPEGMEFPEGEFSQPPEGFEGPGGFPGGRPGMQAFGELGTEFAIVQGGSYFSAVSPA